MIRKLAALLLDSAIGTDEPLPRITGRQAAILVDRYGLRMAVAYILAAQKGRS